MSRLGPRCGCRGRAALWCWLDAAAHRLGIRWDAVCDTHDDYITGERSS